MPGGAHVCRNGTMAERCRKRIPALLRSCCAESDRPGHVCGRRGNANGRRACGMLCSCSPRHARGSDCRPAPRIARILASSVECGASAPLSGFGWTGRLPARSAPRRRPQSGVEPPHSKTSPGREENALGCKSDRPGHACGMLCSCSPRHARGSDCRPAPRLKRSGSSWSAVPGTAVWVWLDR